MARCCCTLCYCCANAWRTCAWANGWSSLCQVSWWGFVNMVQGKIMVKRWEGRGRSWHCVWKRGSYSPFSSPTNTLSVLVNYITGMSWVPGDPFSSKQLKVREVKNKFTYFSYAIWSVLLPPYDAKHALLEPCWEHVRIRLGKRFPILMSQFLNTDISFHICKYICICICEYLIAQHLNGCSVYASH